MLNHFKADYITILKLIIYFFLSASFIVNICKDKMCVILRNVNVSYFHLLMCLN